MVNTRVLNNISFDMKYNDDGFFVITNVVDYITIQIF